jgi:hypothetical protein
LAKFKNKKGKKGKGKNLACLINHKGNKKN